MIDGASDRTALLIIDMQAGLFTPETPRHDAEGVIARINAVARALRQSGGTVVFIQHDGPAGDTFEPGMPGWQLLPSLERESGDVLVHKTACDSFYNTNLATVLSGRGVRRLLVTGCATVRAAKSREYQVVVVGDAHTTADRPHVHAVRAAKRRWAVVEGGGEWSALTRRACGLGIFPSPLRIRNVSRT